MSRNDRFYLSYDRITLVSHCWCENVSIFQCECVSIFGVKVLVISWESLHNVTIICKPLVFLLILFHGIISLSDATS